MGITPNLEALRAAKTVRIHPVLDTPLRKREWVSRVSSSALHLVGKVTLEIVVAPNGLVKSAKMLGGSPVFEETAIQAVKQWKFERADKETKVTVVIGFRFN